MPGERKFEGLAAYDAALDELIANATRTIRIFDKSLGRNFNTPRRYELLGDFLLASRVNRVQIVLHDTSNLVRDCPRLMTLFKRFSHSVAIQQTLAAARNVYDPFAVSDDFRFVRRFHHSDLRGVATIGDIAASSLLIKRFSEIWEASAPSLAATTIGL
jgi:hypothetical protein